MKVSLKCRISLTHAKQNFWLTMMNFLGVFLISFLPDFRVGAEFLKNILGYSTCYNSDPTWGNHGLIFK